MATPKRPAPKRSAPKRPLPKPAPKKGLQFKVIMNGANGYLAYDNWNKKYVYHVTKDPLSATVGVIANGWGAAGAGFGPQWSLRR